MPVVPGPVVDHSAKAKKTSAPMGAPQAPSTESKITHKSLFRKIMNQVWAEFSYRKY